MNKKTNLNNEPINIEPTLLKQVCTVFSQFTQIKSVTLFGSRAKGTHKYYSDIDIAVIGSNDILFCEKINAELSQLPTLLHFDVINYDTLKNNALKTHINRVGKLLYCNE